MHTRFHLLNACLSLSKGYWPAIFHCCVSSTWDHVVSTSATVSATLRHCRLWLPQTHLQNKSLMFSRHGGFWRCSTGEEAPVVAGQTLRITATSYKAIKKEFLKSGNIFQICCGIFAVWHRNSKLTLAVNFAGLCINKKLTYFGDLSSRAQGRVTPVLLNLLNWNNYGSCQRLVLWEIVAAQLTTSADRKPSLFQIGRKPHLTATMPNNYPETYGCGRMGTTILNLFEEALQKHSSWQ